MSQCHVSKNKNVGDKERLVSFVTGSLLSLRSLKTIPCRPLFGTATLAFGAALMARGLTGHCAAYQAAGVSTDLAPSHPGINIMKSVTIRRSAQDLFDFWRKLENLPTFMQHLASVTQSGTERSHWVSNSTLGIPISWEAELTAEKEGEYLAWKSIPGSELENLGSVRFLPTPKGETLVNLHVRYNPPAGAFGKAVTKLFGPNPETQIMNDLLRFKQLMESGEIASTEGQPEGQRKLFEFTQIAERRLSV